MDYGEGECKIYRPSQILQAHGTICGQVHGDGDRLFNVEEAAAKLGTTRDYLYRHADALPFTVRLGRKQVRFSEAGMDRYIRNRAGR